MREHRLSSRKGRARPSSPSACRGDYQMHGHHAEANRRESQLGALRRPGLLGDLASAASSSRSLAESSRRPTSRTSSRSRPPRRLPSPPSSGSGWPGSPTRTSPKLGVPRELVSCAMTETILGPPECSDRGSACVFPIGALAYEHLVRVPPARPRSVRSLTGALWPGSGRRVGAPLRLGTLTSFGEQMGLLAS